MNNSENNSKLLEECLDIIEMQRQKIAALEFRIQKMDAILNVNNYFFHGRKLSYRSRLYFIYQTPSWKVIRGLHKIQWKLKGLPKQKNIIPVTEQLAKSYYKNILISPLWLLLLPIHLIYIVIKRNF